MNVRFRKCFRPALSALLGTGLLLTSACSKHAPAERGAAADSTNRLNQELLDQLAHLEAQERQLNESVWGPEILAQSQGRIFESLWDAANLSTNKLAVLAEFPIGAVLLGRWSIAQSLPHDITVRLPAGPGELLTESEWRPWVRRFDAVGWELGELEFRHTRFTIGREGQPEESTFYFAAQLTNSRREERALIEGDLIVHWAPPDPEALSSPVRQIDASRLTLKSRTGPPLFAGRILDRISPPTHTESIDPLLVYDLDHDGLSEIIFVAGNLAYYRTLDSDAYRSQPLCQSPVSAVYTAVIADFDSDGFPDLLVAALEGLMFFAGSGTVTFDQPARLAFPGTLGDGHPMVLTAGDIDADGDLDLFLGQYRVPYEGGSLPTPYHDANDGHPAYLLVNDGRAGFTDATRAANLEAKRWRRTYSASFVDFDSDGHLDLVVVSDFAGLDLHRNDGKGRFTDVTESRVPDPHAFGMSHAFADFNADGRLDLLMVGMTSPTVDRLQHLNLVRADVPEDRSLPGRMMYGNRLYLARGDGGFEQTRLSDDVARSGWSWGCAAFDFDNDAFVDLFIANGLESRSSVRDYESEYWLHDRFVGKSRRDPAVYLYFQSKFNRTRGRGHSYGGYERNRFYLNQAGAKFDEVGHLLGMALQEDARHAVADDLDGDGRVDLIVTGFETWPASRRILRVYRNRLEPSGHWIGFRLREEAERLPPTGATITLHQAGRTTIGALVTGDSHRSQASSTIHFGLGDVDRVEKAEIRWPGGGSLTIPDPVANRYHPVRAPRLIRSKAGI